MESLANFTVRTVLCIVVNSANEAVFFVSFNRHEQFLPSQKNRRNDDKLKRKILL